MDALSRIETGLNLAFARAQAPSGPPLLAAAMRHAVFPGGARVRPRLCLAVAHACGDDAPLAADAAATAIELLHCASLVHDDLPCFDDAATRRGNPSVHAAFGEPLAVLAGDALIVLAFQSIAWGALATPMRLGPLILTIGQAVGMPNGIVAGQAWEVDKPVGRDAALGRPSAVLAYGIEGALDLLESLTRSAAESIPDCPGAGALRKLIAQEARRLVPPSLSRVAA